MNGQIQLLPTRPLSAALEQELTRIKNAVPTDKRGTSTVTVSRTGVDVGVGWKVKPWLTTEGYAQRQWGGGWEAGARVNLVW